jgi:hypothetical protein
MFCLKKYYLRFDRSFYHLTKIKKLMTHKVTQTKIIPSDINTEINVDKLYEKMNLIVSTFIKNKRIFDSDIKYFVNNAHLYKSTQEGEIDIFRKRLVKMVEIIFTISRTKQVEGTKNRFEQEFNYFKLYECFRNLMLYNYTFLSLKELATITQSLSSSKNIKFRFILIDILKLKMEEVFKAIKDDEEELFKFIKTEASNLNAILSLIPEIKTVIFTNIFPTLLPGLEKNFKKYVKNKTTLDFLSYFKTFFPIKITSKINLENLSINQEESEINISILKDIFKSPKNPIESFNDFKEETFLNELDIKLSQLIKGKSNDLNYICEITNQILFSSRLHNSSIKYLSKTMNEINIVSQHFLDNKDQQYPLFFTDLLKYYSKFYLDISCYSFTFNPKLREIFKDYDVVVALFLNKINSIPLKKFDETPTFLKDLIKCFKFLRLNFVTCDKIDMFLDNHFNYIFNTATRSIESLFLYEMIISYLYCIGSKDSAQLDRLIRVFINASVNMTEEDINHYIQKTTSILYNLIINGYENTEIIISLLNLIFNSLKFTSLLNDRGFVLRLKLIKENMIITDPNCKIYKDYIAKINKIGELFTDKELNVEFFPWWSREHFNKNKYGMKDLSQLLELQYSDYKLESNICLSTHHKVDFMLSKKGREKLFLEILSPFSYVQSPSLGNFDKHNLFNRKYKRKLEIIKNSYPHVDVEFIDLRNLKTKQS